MSDADKPIGNVAETHSAMSILASVQLGEGCPRAITDEARQDDLNQAKAAVATPEDAPAPVVGKKPKGSPQPAQKVLQSKVVWVDTPQTLDQFGDPNESRQTDLEIMVLNLSKPEDLAKYAEVRKLELNIRANRVLLANERRYVEKEGYFVVYVEIGTFQFREHIPAALHEQRKKTL